jgi:hypothetical protein
MKRNSPPAFACWLLESVVPAPYREAMLGDLIEEYALRAESASSPNVMRWFWSQACRSVPPMVWSSLGSRDWLISMSIAMGVYIVLEVLEYGAHLAVSRWVATAAIDVCPSCAGSVSRRQRNRWLCGCANSSRRNDIPRIDGNDYGCHFDRPKGLHNTGTVVV